jgi:hypothetical protein
VHVLDRLDEVGLAEDEVGGFRLSDPDRGQLHGAPAFRIFVGSSSAR